jgi:hypothetical protein
MHEGQLTSISKIFQVFTIKVFKTQGFDFFDFSFDISIDLNVH